MTRARIAETHPGFAGVLRAFIVLHVGLGLALTFGPSDWFTASGYDTHRQAVSTVWHIATPMRIWGAAFLTAGLALASGYTLDVPSGTAERVLGPGIAWAALVMFVWDVPFVVRFAVGISTGVTAPIAYTALFLIHVEAAREPFRNPLRDSTIGQFGDGGAGG